MNVVEGRHRFHDIRQYTLYWYRVKLHNIIDNLWGVETSMAVHVSSYSGWVTRHAALLTLDCATRTSWMTTWLKCYDRQPNQHTYTRNARNVTSLMNQSEPNPLWLIAVLWRQKRYRGWHLNPLHQSNNHISPEISHFVDDVSPTIQKHIKHHDTPAPTYPTCLIQKDSHNTLKTHAVTSNCVHTTGRVKIISELM